MRTSTTLSFAARAALATLSACSGRPQDWNSQPPSSLMGYGLASAAVVLDDPTHRAIVLTPHADESLGRSALPVGHDVLAATTSPDRARLFVLSAGDAPRRSSSDEYPSLTVIDASSPAVTSKRFDMAEPLGNLAIDPEGHWAAAFAGSNARTSFVQNPNEIVLFDLTQPAGSTKALPRTIRSFGGYPQRLTFTPTLNLPKGPRRLLVIETDRDVTLLDLDRAADSPPPPEVTVRLTNGSDARVLQPAGVVVDAGDPAHGVDARVAVRTANDSNVITLDLGPAPPTQMPGGNDFSPVVNLTDVGAIPTDFAFVHVDSGQLRLAALTPAKSSAVLVDPDNSQTENVALPASYQSLSIVTSLVGSAAAPGTDVALLWNASSGGAGVAFWMLGVTAGQPYRSVEVLGFEQNIQTVVDVPAPNAQLKLLQTASSSSFYVLDLGTRTAAPLETSGGPTLEVSPDGARVWAYERGTSQLAALELTTLHPVPLYTDRPITTVFDVADDGGGRSLLALHGTGSVGVTLFDALNPDTAKSRIYSGILLEGL